MVLADVSSNSSLIEKTDIKLELEKKKVVVKERSQNFMILAADLSTMDPLAKARHDMFCAAILQEPELATASVTGDIQGGGGDTQCEGNTM